MDPAYSDRIEELMDREQAWAQDIEEIYNKLKFIPSIHQKEMLRMLE